MESMNAPAYKRILLKISGEALAAGQGFGVDNTRVHEIASELAEVHSLGTEIAIVVGGGNFFREWPSKPSSWTASRLITWGCWRQ